LRIIGSPILSINDGQRLRINGDRPAGGRWPELFLGGVEPGLKLVGWFTLFTAAK
jgi:hypothetical protein